MNKKTILIRLLAVSYSLITITCYAQGDTAVKRFSLPEAIDFALKHNYSYLNADNDTKLSNYKKNEIVGAGMPQINGGADLRDNLVLPTQLIPAQFVNPMAPPGTY